MAATKHKIWLVDWEDCHQEVYDSIGDAINAARTYIETFPDCPKEEKEEALAMLDETLNNADYNGFYVESWVYCYAVDYIKRGEISNVN